MLRQLPTCTHCQNCVFASKNGDIAIRTQGEWPAKWKGRTVMPGTDTILFMAGYDTTG